jgi:hypothetical protein
MEYLPQEVVSEVLSCLRPCEIASCLSSNRSMHRLLHTMGCVSSATSFRKAVSSSDWLTKYTNHFILAHVPGSSGAVTFRFSPLLYGTISSRKIVLQTLNLAGEHAAAMWVARHSHMALPKGSSAYLFLFRNVPWDFLLYTMVCHGVALSTAPLVRIHIRSIPGVMDHGQCLKSSPQSFLCNLLWHARNKPIVLRLCGTHHDMLHVPVSGAWIDAERRKVDTLFEQIVGADGLQLYTQSDFRSSTVALGMVMTTANPQLEALDLSHYIFDERGPSLDAASFTAWLTWGHHRLVRANLHDISFSCGSDFCNLLQGLCRVKTLCSLRLSCIEYLADAPVDPVRLIFEQGAHIQDVRLIHVMRTHADMPFEALHLDAAYRTLALSRMFLDTGSVKALTVVLPDLRHLVSLDLSSNGIDGACLALFSTVLLSPECRLERLKLTSNIITNISVGRFCAALSRNKSLRVLDLADNFLGTQSGLAILQAMLSSTNQLRMLNLDSNQIRLTMDDLYRELLAASLGFGIFRQVTLRSNPIEIEQRDDLARYKALFADTFRVSFTF